jgi:hypothetical protein
LHNYLLMVALQLCKMNIDYFAHPSLLLIIVRSVHTLTSEQNEMLDWSLRAEQIKHQSAQDPQPILTYDDPCIKCSAHAAYATTRQSGPLNAC